MVLDIQVLLIGLAAGVAGGFFGLGGGAIMVPGLVLLLGFAQKTAQGASIAAQLLPVGLLAAIVYYRNGNLNIKWGLELAVGLMVGALLGAMVVNQHFLSDQLVKKMYGVFLLIIGARYLLWK